MNTTTSNKQTSALSTELNECIKAMMKTEQGFNDFLKLQRILNGIKESV